MNPNPAEIRAYKRVGRAGAEGTHRTSPDSGEIQLERDKVFVKEGKGEQEDHGL